eukprot:4370263-Amphidinium_carterae.2
MQDRQNGFVRSNLKTGESKSVTTPGVAPDRSAACCPGNKLGTQPRGWVALFLGTSELEFITQYRRFGSKTPDGNHGGESHFVEVL